MGKLRRQIIFMQIQQRSIFKAFFFPPRVVLSHVILAPVEVPRPTTKDFIGTYFSSMQSPGLIRATYTEI